MVTLYHTAVESFLWRATGVDTHSALQCFAILGCESYQAGVVVVDFVCACLCICVCLRVCVQAPLESINPKSNRLTAEAAFDVC